MYSERKTYYMELPTRPKAISNCGEGVVDVQFVGEEVGGGRRGPIEPKHYADLSLSLL